MYEAIWGRYQPQTWHYLRNLTIADGFFLQQLMVKNQGSRAVAFYCCPVEFSLVYHNHQLVLSDIHSSCLSCKHCLYLHSNYWWLSNGFPFCGNFLLSRGTLLSVNHNHQLRLSDIHSSCLSCKHCLFLPSNFRFFLCGNLYIYFVVTTSVIFSH